MSTMTNVHRYYTTDLYIIDIIAFLSIVYVIYYYI